MRKNILNVIKSDQVLKTSKKYPIFLDQIRVVQIGKIVAADFCSVIWSCKPIACFYKDFNKFFRLDIKNSILKSWIFKNKSI